MILMGNEFLCVYNKNAGSKTYYFLDLGKMSDAELDFTIR